MKKTTKIRLLTFSLAAVLLLWGAWQDSRLSLQANQTQLEYVYRRALGDLTDYVSGMGSTLEKARYAGTASMQSAVSAQLLEQSGGAKAAMATLPFSQEKTDRISRFLSQVGDYSLALSRKAFSGSPPDERDLQGLDALEEYAGKLTTALTDIQSRLAAEKADIVQTVHLLNNITEIDRLASLDDDFDAVAEEFSQFPTLLYDGPFSDHIDRRDPMYLKKLEPISQDQAASIAAAFLDCPEDSLQFAGEGGGRLPVYSFSTEDSMVNITAQGGLPAYYKKSGAVSQSRLTNAQARNAAKEFLSQLGFSQMAESYFIKNDNLFTINFHSTCQTRDSQEVFCYPDLVKLTIELDQGGMVEMDAAGFLMNAHARSLDPPKISQEEAGARLSPLLRAESTRLAVIPTPGLEEILCWELFCTAAGGTEVLSYINAYTGMEEQLYLLQKDEHGTLVV
ncbi:hypothetical protein D7X94_04415 [Acutalibacter sp. 1XD8-33]|uniref:PepSY1/2 domain-containing protein n=1 Tax=Acutalibacter sp. 1XD8-33 TaxID=2320081 RepID=UPI000EA13BE6|nr:PepSY1/2 domain-containing protein [Acutalibacter sp. 1XD8-33]RKJ41060.1 hypothetical protein D7X94_04415 [Acutalibacter sp. 1XD8-33]